MRAQASRADFRPEPRLFVTITCLVLATAQAGCGVWQQNVSAQRRDSAEQIEPLLEQAGFLRLRADTAAQRSEMKSLKPLTISRSFDKQKGTRYWFADPYVCECVYAGNEAAYERYRELRSTQQVTEQMKASRRLNEQAFDQVSEAPEINMFNPVFAP